MQHRAGGTKGMVKTRVAPAIELIKDVVRAPRLASLEALPWQHPFALSHFLEGVQERCPRQNPWQGIVGRQARPSPFAGKEKLKGSTPCGQGSLREKASPLARRRWRVREGSGPVSKDKTSRRVASGSCQDLRVTPRNAHEGCVAEVLCGRILEDIITTLGAVMMDWTSWSSPIGIARQTEREDSSGPSPAELHHRSESCDIYHACSLDTVVFP
jgi:hypothetical protein